MNSRFGKLIENKIKYAKSYIATETELITNPTDEQYLSFGWKIVDLSYPSDPIEDGYHWERDGYCEDEQYIRYGWKKVQNPPEPNRKWSKHSLKCALAQKGWLTKMSEILSGMEFLPGYDAWDAFNTADYIEENYPTVEQWNATLDAITVKIGKTRTDIDTFLDEVQVIYA